MEDTRARCEDDLAWNLFNVQSLKTTNLRVINQQLSFDSNSRLCCLSSSDDSFFKFPILIYISCFVCNRKLRKILLRAFLLCCCPFYHCLDRIHAHKLKRSASLDSLLIVMTKTENIFGTSSDLTFTWRFMDKVGTAFESGTLSMSFATLR